MRHFYYFLGSTILMSLAIAAAAQPRKDVTYKDVETALHDGKKVVLVVSPTGRKQNDADESYADWADGLNDFAAHAGADIKILKVTPLRLTQLMLQPKVKGDFATLFIRDPEHALVYDGMVVEPKVYEIGLAYLKHHPDEKAESAYGLQEKTVRFK
jgi:hypothetical protein